MYDIITFGSAAQDIHIKSKEFKVLKAEDFSAGLGICLPFGSKVELEDVIFSSGGGGTNTAATFAKQGFKTAFCGAIGADAAGLEIVRELKRLGVDTKFIVKKKDKKTNHSVVISSSGGEYAESLRRKDRTILVYRGAADAFEKDEIKWTKLKAKWFYLAPLTGLLCDTFEDLVNFAHERGIKVAVNPSKQQLNLPEEKLTEILKKVDVLFLNWEEASLLAKIPFENEKEIFQKIDELCPGVAVMTKGGNGAVVSDGKYFYSAPGTASIDTVIVDTTGAGDSFASGFLSAYIRTDGNIEKSIQLGLANGLANLSQVGAKTGILEKDAEFVEIPVLKEECTKNNLCVPKIKQNQEI